MNRSINADCDAPNSSQRVELADIITQCGKRETVRGKDLRLGTDLGRGGTHPYRGVMNNMANGKWQMAKQAERERERGGGRGRFSGVNEAEEGAADGGIDGDEDLIRAGRTGNGCPIRPKAGANWIGLRDQPPADVSRGPGAAQCVAVHRATELGRGD